MQVNLVPKEGGNTFKYYASGTWANDALQQDNIDDDLRGRGLTAAPGVRRIYDAGVGVGGRIIHDKLWFYAAGRAWGASEFQPGNFYNKSTNLFVYEADTSRPAYTETYARDVSARFTWQVNQKHKVTFAESLQYSCQCFLQAGALISPEGAPHVKNGPMSLPQAVWNYPASNRLLFDAGFSYGNFTYIVENHDLLPGAIRIQDTGTGRTWGGNAFGCCAAAAGISPWANNPLSQKFTVSYVGGSHAFKFGEQFTDGRFRRDQIIDPPLWYTFVNGRPVSLTQWAVPHDIEVRLRQVGLYAQDQWTLNRMTLNLGLRFDTFKGWAPAGTRPGGLFTPAFPYDRVDNIPNYSDVTPRIGVAYDVFGNGKTAIKGSFGRYVASLSTSIGEAVHPAAAISTNSTRTWNDANGNFAPDCVLTNFAPNGECGAMANANFGRPVSTIFYDPAGLEGWGVRGYTYQWTASLQQELLPNVALNVSYYRTQYGNFTATANELVTAADFNPYCVTAPADSRLPGGGGNQVCGLYDITRTRFGQVRNVITGAGAIGEQAEKYDGVDVAINARFGGGGLVQGGVSFGHPQSDTCYANNRPDVTVSNQTAYGAFAGTTAPRIEGHCHVSPPWSENTQIKVNGSYPLPLGLEASFNFQNLPGSPYGANLAFSNAAIAPSLGRSLSACPATGTCTSVVQVPLIAPGAVFLDRITQLDLRFTKNVRVGNARLKGFVDFFNVFNANPVLSVNNTYGAAWLRPTAVLSGRLVKLGGQFDF